MVASQRERIMDLQLVPVGPRESVRFRDLHRVARREEVNWINNAK